MNLEGGTKSSKDGSTPEDLAYGCRYGLEGPPLAIPDSNQGQSDVWVSSKKLILFTYFCVKGSIMVTYSASRIFLAKKVPAERIHCQVIDIFQKKLLPIIRAME